MQVEIADPESPEAQQLLTSLSETLKRITGSSGTASFDAGDVKVEKACFAIARSVGGAAVGCGAIRPLAPGVAELKRMFAAPGSKGVGRAVLAFLEQRASHFGYAQVWLETRKVNERAVAFYERHGYRVIDNFGRYVGKPEAVCMGKRLPLPRSAGPVLLRRLRIEDCKSFHAYRSNPSVARYQGWNLMSTSDALAFITEQSDCKLFVPGQWSQVAIAERETNALVGDMGLFLAQDTEHAEVGFTLEPRFTGKGYATAAVSEAMRMIFDHTPVQRIIGITDARNQACVRVLERAGMSRTQARATQCKGEACIEWIYTRLR